MELLAPAGDLKKLKYALHYGADAVYCGVPEFSLRGSRVNKFNSNDLKEAASYTHKKGKKIYITLNIYPQNHQLKKIEENLEEIISLKPDAIIVSDPGVLSLIRKRFPKQEIHLSTQANCINYGSVQFWKEQGVKRIILAREISIAQIKDIKKTVKNIELEYFVHGAMCMAYSGRCMLSSWLNQKSANQGDCTQPCRWPWVFSESRVREKKLKNVRSIEVYEDNGETYLFNSKDLCLVDDLEAIKKSGVDSIKIEGRNKSLYYLVTVVKYYRKVLDAKTKTQRKKIIEEALKEFQKIGNRQYTTGFAYGIDNRVQNFNDSRNLSNYELVGEVVKKKSSLKLSKANFKPIFVHNAIYANQELDVIEKADLRRIKVLEILDSSKNQVDSAHGGTQKHWYIKFDKKIDDWGILRNAKRDNS